MAYVDYNKNDEDDQLQTLPNGQQSSVIQGQQVQGGAPLSSGTPATGGASIKMPQDNTKSNFVSARKILDANRGTDQADITNPYRSQITQAQQGLTSSWDKYTDDLAKTSKASQDALAGVGNVTTDDNSFAGIKNLLTGGIKPADYTNPNDMDTSNISALGSQTGVQQALTKNAQNQGIANYGTAKSALDAALFSSDPASRQRLQSLQQMQTDYGTARDTTMKNASDLQTKTSGQIANDQTEAKAKLAAQSQAITDAAKAQAQQAQKLTPDQVRGVSSQNSDKITALLQSIASGEQGDDIAAKGNYLDKYETRARNPYILDNLMSQFGPGKIGSSSYINVNPSGQPAYTADQATSFNKIASLLNNPAVTKASTGIDPSIDMDKLKADAQKIADTNNQDYNKLAAYSPAVDAAINDITKRVNASHGNYALDQDSYNIPRLSSILGRDDYWKYRGKDPIQDAYDKAMAPWLSQKKTLAAETVDKKTGKTIPWNQMTAAQQKAYLDSEAINRGPQYG